MFLRNHKTKIYLVVILIISTLFTSCRALFPTQRMLDDVLPYRDTHYYCKSDVVPFSREELKNAKTIYGVELSEYFYEFKDMNLPEKEKEEFLRTLTYRNANYTLIKDRYEMYNDDQARDIHDYNQADKEFNAFYKLEDSPLADIIKENNNGQLAGNPNISFKLYLNTCHKVDDIYFEGDAEIYVPVAIPNKEYEKMKIGDKITLTIPKDLEASTSSETRQQEFVMKATDSLCYTDENGEEIAFFVADKDGISEMRRMVDKTGKMIEKYIGMHKIGLLIYSRIAEGINAERLVTAIMQAGVGDYIIDDIVDKVEGGGYLVDKYKEYVYANAVYTNLKGYITTALNYTALFVDNEYAKTYLSEHPVVTKSAQTPVFDDEAFGDFDMGTPSESNYIDDGIPVINSDTNDITFENNEKANNLENNSNDREESTTETSPETEPQETTTLAQDEEVNTATSEPS